MNRFNPKYTNHSVKHPAHLLFWGGITSTGKRVCAFLKYKDTMNSVRYVATLRKALKLLREDGLTLLHDGSKVHTSRMTTTFLQRKKVKSKVIPGNTPDVMPIENLFSRIEQILDNRPTRTIKQREVMKAWRELSDEYIGKLCNSVPSRRDTQLSTEMM